MSTTYENNEQRKKSLKNEIEHLKTIAEMKEKRLEYLEAKISQLEEVEPEPIIEETYWNPKEFV